MPVKQPDPNKLVICPNGEKHPFVRRGKEDNLGYIYIRSDRKQINVSGYRYGNHFLPDPNGKNTHLITKEYVRPKRTDRSKLDSLVTKPKD